MKNTKRGFILIETLIVSVFILSTLVFLYVQFQKIEAGYEKSFIYNTTNNLYKVNNIRDYLLNGLKTGTSNYDNVLTEFLSEPQSHINISDCPSTLILTNTDYCEELFNKLEVKSVIFTRDDLTDLKADVNNLYLLSEGMKDFIRHLKQSGEDFEYRLIVEFNDETYGTLKIYEGI